jgi:molecular chaperone HtpG
MTTERHEFQAEVKQLLDLMVHSLYSDKDVFLRELVSNASDALDKLRFEALTRSELAAAADPEIRIEVDPKARTLSVSDNGIGMSRDEVVKNIGTIAKSGTKEFLAAAKKGGTEKLPPELIGQFGVGFYSSFMVADKVSLVTRRAGESTATSWESQGDGSYTIGDAERATSGTTVTLSLKPAQAEEGLHDYTAAPVIRRIVKRYSDFVGYPIRFQPPATEAGKTPEVETLNSMKAIWDRPKGEVTDEQYEDFYRHVSHDFAKPLATIPVRLEGTLEAYALLYLPAKAPFDLYSPEMRRGLQLYVKRVFVMDECRELMPPWLRFVRGVVDAHDLSLNVSREILQKDRQIQIIKKQIVKRVLAKLDELKKGDDEKYRAFFAEFGPVLKEGLLAPDADHEKILELVVASSTVKSEGTTLDDYVTRMKEGQDAIYYLAAPTRAAASSSPVLERFTQQGYEVLLFSDPIDEVWLDNAPAFKDKKLVSASRGEIKLGNEEQRKKESETLEQQQKDFADLLSLLRVHLQDEIKEVRLSSRLTTSAACLVGDEDDISPRVARMLEQLGQAPPKTKRILELNPTHPLIQGLSSAVQREKNAPRLREYAQLLLGQAHLAESGELADPVAFSKLIADLMLDTVSRRD